MLSERCSYFPHEDPSWRLRAETGPSSSIEDLRHNRPDTERNRKGRDDNSACHYKGHEQKEVVVVHSFWYPKKAFNSWNFMLLWFSPPFFLPPPLPWGLLFPFLLFLFLLKLLVYYYFTLYYLYRIILNPWSGGLDWSSSIGLFTLNSQVCRNDPFLLYHPGEPCFFLPFTFATLLWSCVLIWGHY